MTKYNDSMPARLLKAMQGGHSFQGSCGILGIGRRTGYDWIDQHEEFKAAKEQGDMHALSFFEKIALSKLTGIMPERKPGQAKFKIDTTMAIFMLKTRFHKVYGDKMKIENTSDKDNKVELTLNYKQPKKRKKTKAKKKVKD